MMGAPTKYKIEYIKKVDEYLAICNDTYEKIGVNIPEDLKSRYDKENPPSERIMKVRLPMFEDFALFIGVSKRALIDWKDKYPDFLRALEKIEAEQKKRLINSGISGQYNPLIAKLVLSANHGMKEKTDVTSNDKELTPNSELNDKVNKVIASYLNGFTKNTE